jgi:hypothetical protein
MDRRLSEGAGFATPSQPQDRRQAKILVVRHWIALGLRYLSGKFEGAGPLLQQNMEGRLNDAPIARVESQIVIDLVHGPPVSDTLPFHLNGRTPSEC